MCVLPTAAPLELGIIGIDTGIGGKNPAAGNGGGANCAASGRPLTGCGGEGGPNGCVAACCEGERGDWPATITSGMPRISGGDVDRNCCPTTACVMSGGMLLCTTGCAWERRAGWA